MFRNLTCIECPTGCTVTVTVEGGKAVLIEGYGCRRGHDYVLAEVEQPERILTTTVPSGNLSVRMVPVRTARPIPKALIDDALREIRKLRVSQPVTVGDIVLSDVLGSGVDVIVTRDVS